MAEEIKPIIGSGQAIQTKAVPSPAPKQTIDSTPAQTKEPSFWEKQKQKNAERKAAQAQADAEKYTKPEIELPENQVASGKDQQLLSQTEGINVTGDAAKQGATVNKLLQNVETPKWKRKSLADIWKDPEMKDVRGSLLANAVGTALANATGSLSGRGTPGYQSDLAKYNEEQAANYSKMQAEKDAQAQQANIDAIKAANAQKVALETKLADTIADAYIKRFNATNDVDLKADVLNQMIEHSDELFKSIGNDEQKLFDLATYMGLLSGDFSLTARLVQKYVPQLLNKLDGIKSIFGGGTDNTQQTVSDDVKKKYSQFEVDEEGNVPGVVGPVNLTDVEKNPKNYKEIYTGNGQRVMLKRGSLDVAQAEEFAQWLFDNPNMTDEEKKDAFVFGLTDWTKPVLLGRSPLQGMFDERDKSEEELRKQEAAIKKYNEDTLDAIDKQKQLLATNKDPQKVLEWAEKNKPNENADSQTVAQYNGLIKSANEKKMDAELLAIGSSDWDDNRKVDEYDKILSSYSDYMTPGKKKEIQDLRQVVYDKAKIYTPYRNAVNTALKANVKAPNTVWGITDDGNLSYVYNGAGSGSYKPVENPETFDFTYGQSSQNLFNQLVYEMTPDTIRNKIGGNTDKEKAVYFTTSPMYKIMGKLVRNQAVKDYAKKNPTSDIAQNYNTLVTNYNKISQGTFFK